MFALYIFIYSSSSHRIAPVCYNIVKICLLHNILILGAICSRKDIKMPSTLRGHVYARPSLKGNRRQGKRRITFFFVVLVVVVGNARSATKAVHHWGTLLNDSFVGFKTFSSGRVSASPELPPHRLFYSRCDLVGFVFAVIRVALFFSLSLHSPFPIGIPPGKIYPQILALRKTHH